MKSHRLNNRTMSCLALMALVSLECGNTALCQVPRGYFTDVSNLGPTVNSSSGEGASSISGDGLTIYFVSDRPGGYGDWDIYQATRPTVNGSFDDVTNLGQGVNSSSGDVKPTISFDGLTLYFRSTRTGGFGSSDIYQATRPRANDAFGNVMNLGPGINTPYDERPSYISPDGLTLYFMSTRPGGEGEHDIYMATRDNLSDLFDNVANLGPGLNSPVDDYGPSLSADGLFMFFTDSWNAPFRPGGWGGIDIWVASRTFIDQAFGNVVNLNAFSLGSKINGPSNDYNVSISHDWPASGSRIYFTDDRPGGLGYIDLWQATWVAIDPNAIVLPAGSRNALADAIAETGPGGKVVLAPGEHHESSSVLIDIPVTLQGEPGAVMKSGVLADTTSSPFDISPALHIRGTHDVIVEGIAFERSQTRKAAGTAVVIEDSPWVVVRNCAILEFQFGVIVQRGDHAEISGNAIHLAAGVGARGISNVNGQAVKVAGNYVNGGFLGIFCGGLYGQCRDNVVEETSLGYVLCGVRDGVFDISGDTRGTVVPATGWYVAGNEAHNNEWGYLVIDGAARNTLVNNRGSGNSMYDLELAGDSERFGFFTPASSENVVVYQSVDPLTVKDCGLDNIVSGDVVLIDKEGDPCF